MAAERLTAVGALQAAVGERLSVIAAGAAAAQRALPGDPAAARAHTMAAGGAAREAIARARGLTASRRSLSGTGCGAGRRAAASARVAWAVLVVVLCRYAAAGLNDAVIGGTGPRLMTLLAIGTVAGVALQVHHSWAVHQGGRPRAWPLTLGLQAATGVRVPVVSAGG